MLKSNAFTLERNQVNLESGTSTSNSVYLCVEDGSLSIVFSEGDTAVTIDCVKGDAYTFNSVVSITISSGKFHRAN